MLSASNVRTNVSLQLFFFLSAQVVNDSDFESPVRAVRKRRHPLSVVSGGCVPRRGNSVNSFMECACKHSLHLHSVGRCH